MHLENATYPEPGSKTRQSQCQERNLAEQTRYYLWANWKEKRDCRTFVEIVRKGSNCIGVRVFRGHGS